MEKSLLGIAIAAAAPIASAGDPTGAATVTPAQTIERAGSQTTTVGPPEYFTGRVRVEPLFRATASIAASAAYVTFDPGARSAWHTHPAGQRLVVVSGVGRTQEWGKPVQEIRAGDVIVCPPDVKHWHGAAPGSSMTHLAITGVLDGVSVQWLEKVSDAEYERG